MTKGTKQYFECTFGNKSHISLFGKIVLSPFILMIGGLFMIFDFLFGKKGEVR